MSQSTRPTQRRLPEQQGTFVALAGTQTPQRYGQRDALDEERASPHRAGHYVGIHPEDRPYSTNEAGVIRHSLRGRSTVASQRNDEADYHDEDEFYDTRSHSSARRYQQQVLVTQGPHTIVRYHYQQVPPRRSRATQSYPHSGQQHQQSHPPEKEQTKAQHRQWYPLFYVGITIVTGLALFVVISTGLSWWRVYQDDVQYGRPRTYQCDVRVGHNDAHTPSHFLVLNLNTHVEVIEFPGGDASKAEIYQGPTLIGEGQDLTPVTLEFRDVNRDGKPDMILHIGESRYVFLNDTVNGIPQFRPVKPTDTVML